LYRCWNITALSSQKQLSEAQAELAAMRAEREKDNKFAEWLQEQCDKAQDEAAKLRAEREKYRAVVEAANAFVDTPLVALHGDGYLSGTLLGLVEAVRQRREGSE
jgi:hypothetical protein